MCLRKIETSAEAWSMGRERLSESEKVEQEREAFYARQRSRISRTDAFAIAGITLFMLVALREHRQVLWWAVVVLSQVLSGLVAQLHREQGPTEGSDEPTWVRAAELWWVRGSSVSWALLPVLLFTPARETDVAWILAFFVIFGLASDAMYLPQTYPDNLVTVSTLYCVPALAVLGYYAHWIPAAAIIGILIHVTSAARWVSAIVRELILERVQADAKEDTAKLAAKTDPLTGLWNRAGLLAELATLRDDTANGSISVCFVDLDDFKHVNDQFGYSVGDDLLVRFGKALNSVLPAGWTAGRFGGDEFVAIGPGRSGREIAGAIAAIAIPPTKEATARPVRASIGTAISERQEADPLTMLHHAGAAVREAKRNEPNSTSFSDDELRSQLARRSDFEKELAGAITHGEFEGLLQPQVNLRTGEIWGVELLARWPRGDEIVGPGEFVPIISKLGLDLAFDLCMLDKGIELLETLPRNIQVSVNVGTRRLSSPEFLSALAERLEQSSADPSRLTLEVTETDDLSLSRETLDLVAEIVAMGPRLSLDDFGTGFSSITRLVAIPFSELKLDLTLVRRLKNPETRDLIRTLAGFAERHMLEVVAEGVETEWQAAQLRQIGIPSGQGYLYSKPIPVADFVALITPEETGGTVHRFPSAA